jgi:prepilin peptidase CpaA
MSLIWLLFAALAVAAAAMDLAQYRIPNAIVLSLIGLFLAVAAMHFPSVSWSDHVVPAIATLAVTATIYALGGMGAGDAKLIAVMALWSGMPMLLSLLLWTTVSGLLMVLVLVPSRLILSQPAVQHRFNLGPLPRILRRKEGVPYGVAIAIGALLASPSFSAWLWKL